MTERMGRSREPLSPVVWRLNPTNRRFSNAVFDPSDLLESGIEALAVQMVVVQDGFVTGWDVGALGFDEDAVWFSGRACSFRVFAADILPRLSDDARSLENSLYLAHPRRSVAVRIGVLSVPDRDHVQDTRFLDARLIDLRQRRASAGESQYPPLTPRPDMIVRRFPRPSFAGGAAIGVVLVIAAILWPLTIPFLIVLAAFLSRIGPFLTPQQAALRRIAAEEAGNSRA